MVLPLVATAVALAIVPFADWLATLTHEIAVIGPGLAGQRTRLPKTVTVAPPEDWQPRAASLLALGLSAAGERSS